MPPRLCRTERPTRPSFVTRGSGRPSPSPWAAPHSAAAPAKLRRWRMKFCQCPLSSSNTCPGKNLGNICHASHLTLGISSPSWHPALLQGPKVGVKIEVG
ncbi:uncharacterized protein [Triticum aestivum]|uniref:uncharacterized protein isoform X2 n=1 Tax=Triticum aestivum TaxID=4565 RepID=UPI001D001D2C|nr:uncharacterized protein LOC123177295 isoform X2 [Triticum aestivum]